MIFFKKAVKMDILAALHFDGMTPAIVDEICFFFTAMIDSEEEEDPQP